MPLSTSQIQSIAHQLDANATADDLRAAAIVLDVTLNGITEPMRLAVRHMCPYRLVRHYLTNMRKYKAMDPEWLEQTAQDATVNIIEFWLHVMLAQGRIDRKTINP